MNDQESNIIPYWLTTSDNKYNPFNPDEFVNWYKYDNMYHANISGLIARIANTSTDLPDDEYTLEVNNAITTIITNGLAEDYKRVSEKDYANSND